MVAVTYHYLRNTCNLYKGIHPLDWYTFGYQMDYLLTSESTLLISEDIERYLNQYSYKNNKKKYIITFDDGLKEHLRAAEELAKKGIKGIFSIIGCPIIEGRIPLVHKLHWLRSKLEPSYFNSELIKNLRNPLIVNEEVIEKAKKMHIHDDIETAIIKYNLNFLVDYGELDFVSSIIIKKHIDSEESFCDKFFLNIEEIKKISEMGHIIAWHSKSHIPMSKLNEQELKKDLNIGEKFLNNFNTKDNKHLCYPYGRLDALPLKNLETISSSNFKYGWTLEEVRDEFINKKYNKLLLQRITSNELFNNIANLCF